MSDDPHSTGHTTRLRAALADRYRIERKLGAWIYFLAPGGEEMRVNPDSGEASAVAVAHGQGPITSISRHGAWFAGQSRGGGKRGVVNGFTELREKMGEGG